MNDREKWRERVRDIRASGSTWWSYIVGYFFKLELISFYNRDVYYYTRIFLILLPHPVYIYIYIYIYARAGVCDYDEYQKNLVSNWVITWNKSLIAKLRFVGSFQLYTFFDHSFKHLAHLATRKCCNTTKQSVSGLSNQAGNCWQPNTRKWKDFFINWALR